MVEASEKDEDGDPITTMVVDWSPPGTAPNDPWAKPKRQDQRTAVLRLKRVLMAILADQGVDLPVAPDGPVVRMVGRRLERWLHRTLGGKEEPARSPPVDTPPS